MAIHLLLLSLLHSQLLIDLAVVLHSKHLFIFILPPHIQYIHEYAVHQAMIMSSLLALLSHIYFQFSLILTWVVINEVGTTVPKSTIPKYINEVGGRISNGFGFHNNWFGFGTSSPFFVLFINFLQMLFLWGLHWLVWYSSLDLRIVNKSCTLALACFHLLCYVHYCT